MTKFAAAVSFVCIYLSCLALAAGVFGAIFLTVNEVMMPSSFFSNLGYALAIAALAAGNLLSFLLNLLCWALHFRPRWLRIALMLQVIPALVSVAGGIWLFITQ